MVICKWCKRHEGTNQLYRMDQHGEKHPSGKLCDECWAVFKTPSKTLQRLLKKDGVKVDIPIKPTCVFVWQIGHPITCQFNEMADYLMEGYKLVGVAETENGLKYLVNSAKGAKS